MYYMWDVIGPCCMSCTVLPQSVLAHNNYYVKHVLSAAKIVVYVTEFQ